MCSLKLLRSTQKRKRICERLALAAHFSTAGRTRADENAVCESDLRTAKMRRLRSGRSRFRWNTHSVRVEE